MHITTVYYIILQLSVQYQFISSISTGAWKNLQDHKLKRDQSPQLTNFHLSVAAMCCRRSSRFSLFVKGKSQATPVSHLKQLRSFTVGFYRPQDHLSINFAMSCVVNKNLRNQLTNSTEINFVDSQKKNTIDHDISGITISTIHTWKNSRLLGVTSFNWCAAQQGLKNITLEDGERAWIPKGATWPAVAPATHGSSHPNPGVRRGSEAFIR